MNIFQFTSKHQKAVMLRQIELGISSHISDKAKEYFQDEGLITHKDELTLKGETFMKEGLKI